MYRYPPSGVVAGRRPQERTDTATITMASVSNRRGQQSLLSNGPNDKSSVSAKGKGGGNGKASAAAVNDAPVIYDTGTGGCLICKKDTDHDRLLICEFCNAEYHIYCLDPPLEAVPEGDFFCGEFYGVLQ